MTSAPRPRIEGEREQEIFDATLGLLAEVGYDRLTMDAVAATARASKATLYRRWASKSELVVEAFRSRKPPAEVPDTGSLRDDLLAVHCRPDGVGSMSDPRVLAVQAAIVTALVHDPEFAAAYRRDFIGPRVAVARAIFERARDRGEISPDADLDLLAPALPALVLHRSFLLGDAITDETVAALIDRVVLPAAQHGARPPAP